MQALKGFAVAAFIVLLGASSANASSTAKAHYGDWLTQEVRHRHSHQFSNLSSPSTNQRALVPAVSE
jgi:hypothetical protein